VKIYRGEPQVGDYVLATKFSDGDPRDRWCVGFVKEIDKNNGKKYCVTFDEQTQWFRRACKIDRELGEWIVKHIKTLEQASYSIWFYARQEKARRAIEEVMR